LFFESVIVAKFMKNETFFPSNFLVCSITSILFILTLPPFRQSWLAGIALVPLLLLIKRENSFLKNFLLGTLAWFPYCAIGLRWLIYFDIWTYLDALVSHLPFLGMFLGFTGLILKKFPENIFAHFLIPAVVWMCLSLIYDLTPLSAAGTQALFYQPIEWMETARFFGVYWVVFLFLMLNASIAFIFKFRSNIRFIPLLLSVVLLIGNFLWGKKALAETFPAAQKVALIQHNLPVYEKWWDQNQGYIMNRYRALALEAAKGKPEVIIFPSFALPIDAYRNPNFFGELARETGSYILVSTYIPKIPNQPIPKVGQYEVAILYSPKAEISGVYRAVQAPPFRKINEVLTQETDILESPLGKIGVLLCFEDTLSRHAKAEVKKGAQVLVAISNPGHFTKTFMPGYHLYQDQLRAIETGRFVIRVSANGYSAVIDPRGRIVKHTELGKQQILYGELPSFGNKTI